MESPRRCARSRGVGVFVDGAVGIVGGRLYHVATDPELYFTAGRNPWNAFKIWDGGLAFGGRFCSAGSAP